MDELANFLCQSLSDGKLSGNERAALADWLAANIRTEQDRGLARHTLFDVARAAGLEPGPLVDWIEQALKAIEPLQKSAAAPVETLSLFSPGDACRLRIAHRFAQARRAADLCVFTITDDRIANAILDAHRRGLHLRLLTDNDKAFDLGSDIDRLAAAGIEVRVDRTPFHMHHKFAIFDGRVLLNGSYNWTRGAAEQNCENLVESNDPALIGPFQAEFERLWASLA
jgi:mitochondrial cardiolipin hydrolase